MKSSLEWSKHLMKRFFWLSLMTFGVFLPLLCHDMPQSVYYKLMTAENDTELRLYEENELRIKEADVILNKSANYGYRKMEYDRSDSSVITVAMSVLTMSRDGLGNYSPKYLTQVIANLLNVVHHHEATGGRIKVHLSMYNGEWDHRSHKEAEHLSKYVPMLLEPHTFSGGSLHVKERMKRGYIACLKELFKMQTDFIFVIEDDAVPLPNMMTVLENVLQRFISPNRTSRGISADDILAKTAFIKFYHPDRLLGFIAFDPERIPELCSFSIIISSVLTVLYCIYQRASCSQSDQVGDIRIKQVWKYFFIYAIVLCLCIGRVNMIRFHELFSPYLYYLTKSPSCCTQAVLYTRAHLPTIISQLEKVTCNMTYASDDALDDIISNTGLKSYLVQPNVFNNIGLYSALRKIKISPYLII